MSALVVLLCGGAGAVARFTVDTVVQGRFRGEFPLGTLIVNLSGSCLLGFVVGAGASHATMLLAGTATLGSYTTFSTWMLETHRPAQDGEPGLAWLNITVSLLAGLGAVALGRAAGGLF